MWIAIGIIIGVYAVLSAVHYAYQTIWNFVVLSPADIHRQQTGEISGLKRKVQEFEKQVQLDSARRLARLSVSLKTEQRNRPFFMKSLHSSSGGQLQANVSEMSLMVYNHVEKPVRLKGYKLWKLEAVEPTQEIALHDVVTAEVPKAVDATEPILGAISDTPIYIFESLLGEYVIRIVVTYFQESASVDTEPYDFRITCKRSGGGMTLRIEAGEIPQTQS
jgi:hypothetical protein